MTIANLILLAAIAAAPSEAPPAPREFRAVWVATVGNIDWPTRPGLTTDEQKAEAVAILDQAAQLHLNAVILQVRTAADALYDSPIEPWSAYLSGEQGRPPEPFYDPLVFWLDEAHRRGLTLHAWINPFRARVAGARYEETAGHIAKAHPDRVRSYGTSRWMDPGEPGAFAQTLRVVADLAQRYDLDGLHIDDYFYPYPIPDPDHPGQELPFPDNASWDKAVASGYIGERGDWRRGNITRLIETMAETIRAERPTALFGISPFGIPRPGQPAGVVGFDQYDKLHADAVLWLNKGLCDYIAPQLYWKIDAPGQPFRPLLDEWVRQNTRGRHVWPGLSTSRVGPGARGYSPDEILNQIAILRANPGATGSIFFSQKSLRANKLGIADRLLAGPYREPALIPASPWIGAKAPGRPEVETKGIGAILTVMPTPAPGSTPFLWAVQALRGDRWEFSTHPASEPRFTLLDGVEVLSISAVDRLGNASEPALIVRPVPPPGKP